MAQTSLDVLLQRQESALIHNASQGFYRITFEILVNGRSTFLHTMTVNPEDITRDDASNVTITNTLGGIWVDDFGLGVMEYNIKGTTGYRAKRTEEGDTVDGLEEVKMLRDQIYRYFMEPNGSKKDKTNDEYQLLYHDWLLEEHYSVQPVKQFRIARSKQQAILYGYDFSFVVLNPVVANAPYYAQRDPLSKFNNLKPRLQSAYDTLNDGSSFLRAVLANITGFLG